MFMAGSYCNVGCSIHIIIHDGSGHQELLTSLTDSGQLSLIRVTMHFFNKSRHEIC